MPIASHAQLDAKKNGPAELARFFLSSVVVDSSSESADRDFANLRCLVFWHMQLEDSIFEGRLDF